MSVKGEKSAPMNKLENLKRKIADIRQGSRIKEVCCTSTEELE